MLYIKESSKIAQIDKNYDSIIKSLIANTTPVKVGTSVDTMTTFYSYQIGRLVTIQFFCGTSRKMTNGQEILLMKDLPLPEWNGDSLDYNINPRASAYLFWDRFSYILNAHVDGIRGNLVIRPEQTGDFGFRGQITYICRNS